jgi:hypothetical protein
VPPTRRGVLSTQASTVPRSCPSWALATVNPKDDHERPTLLGCDPQHTQVVQAPDLYAASISGRRVPSHGRDNYTVNPRDRLLKVFSYTHSDATKPHHEAGDGLPSTARSRPSPHRRVAEESGQQRLLPSLRLPLCLGPGGS